MSIKRGWRLTTSTAKANKLRWSWPALNPWEQQEPARDKQTRYRRRVRWSVPDGARSQHANFTTKPRLGKPGKPRNLNPCPEDFSVVEILVVFCTSVHGMTCIHAARK